MVYVTEYKSPVGQLTLACDGESLTGLWLEGQKYFCSTVKEEMVSEDEIPLFHQVKLWLDEYFSGKQPEISRLPLAPSGSQFRQEVWKLLCRIPYGQVTTYGKIAEETAKRMGRPTMSAQAIGGAVGHNPISIIIPCHRIIGSDRSLTGYAGGIDKKEWLLAHEGVKTEDMEKIYSFL